MERIANKLEALAQDLATNQTKSDTPKELQNYNSSLASTGEINALDLIGNKVSTEDLLKAEELIRLNFGVDYPKEKFQVLWEMILEDGWTDYRLRETVKWFLKTKKFPTWTIADWFDYGVKLYPYSKYVEEVSKHGSVINKQIEWYRVNGQVLWKWKDGNSLPLQKLD